MPSGPLTRGFSLLELAIVLAITALMAGYGMRFNAMATQHDCGNETVQELTEIRQAFERFLAARTRYPLPAGRSLNAHDPMAGREMPSGTDSRIDRIAGDTAVLIGALPFEAMGLSPEQASDCWGNKYSYAVTEALTDAAHFANPLQQGRLEMRDGTLAAPTVLVSDAAYAVLSHGPDALGASAHNYGGAKKNCNSQWADAAVTRIDKENCDTQNRIFFAASLQDGDQQATFFDDAVIYGTKPPLQVIDPSIAPDEEAPPSSSCSAEVVSWGGNCSAPALVTLLGLSVTLTNTHSGYTGVAVSTCHGGSRTTVGTCLPIGTCSATSPRGGPLVLLTGISMNYGLGVCKKYSCCSGTIRVSSIFPCPLVDLPGLASCP